MEKELRYIELKTGYSDDGPAWIGQVKLSKSGNTVYFNNKAFQKWNGVRGNYFDVETGEEYWISRIKKDGSNRHWAGRGKIVLARAIVGDYLAATGQRAVDQNRFVVEDIPEVYPIERIEKLKNRVL